jgi:membrane associated rhomboid family serine protease
MLETFCACLKPVTAPESQIGAAIACRTCGKPVTFVSAEAITPAAAVGDFDARLIITDGPASVGRVLALGGVPDLEVGKSTDRHIQLPGSMVSRAHARLTRLDFGPSRWKVQDTQSRNGVFVNDQKITEAELRDGDRLRIGDFELTYVNRVPAPPVVPVPGGVVCPGCQQTFPAATKFCVSCGINIETGRPMVTSRALDENDLAIRTDTWVRLVSWILWFGLFPIASEAFGTKKAKSIWWITGITIAASLLFFIPYYTRDIKAQTPWMMWGGTFVMPDENELQPAPHDSMRVLEKKAELLNRLNTITDDLPHFHVYQLITAALIHAGILHLAGNMVFMLVFGVRVNELIGNLKMAVIYPILAVCSGLIYLFAARNDPLHPSLGASGAIMGLAGMYFVFFPVQKVHMLIWIRFGILRMFYKVFRMSGFWLLVLWVGLNDLLPTLLSGSNTHDGVAHWAHLGGFISGFVIAIGLLVTRQTSAHGSDLLSMVLGPTAWKIIGRPTTA